VRNLWLHAAFICFQTSSQETATSCAERLLNLLQLIDCSCLTKDTCTVWKLFISWCHCVVNSQVPLGPLIGYALQTGIPLQVRTVARQDAGTVDYVLPCPIENTPGPPSAGSALRVGSATGIGGPYGHAERRRLYERIGEAALGLMTRLCASIDKLADSRALWCREGLEGVALLPEEQQNSCEEANRKLLKALYKNIWPWRGVRSGKPFFESSDIIQHMVLQLQQWQAKPMLCGEFAHYDAVLAFRTCSFMRHTTTKPGCMASMSLWACPCCSRSMVSLWRKMRMAPSAVSLIKGPALLHTCQPMLLPAAPGLRKHMSAYLNMECTHWLVFDCRAPGYVEHKLRAFRIDGATRPVEVGAGSAGSEGSDGAGTTESEQVFEVFGNAHPVEVGWMGWQAHEFRLHIGHCPVRRQKVVAYHDGLPLTQGQLREVSLLAMPFNHGNVCNADTHPHAKAIHHDV